MRIKLVLHGRLKELCPEGGEFEADTPAEAMRALFTQVKAFRPRPGQQRFRVRCVECKTPDELFAPAKTNVLNIVPDFAGGKNGGMFQVLLGAVIMAVSWWNPLGWYGGGALMSGILFGASLVLGGIVSLLSPAPQFDLGEQAQDPAASKYLGPPKNTTTIGTRIPLIYGKAKHGGHYLSFDIQAKDVPV